MWRLSGSGGAEPDAVLPDGRPELVLNAGDPFLYYGAFGVRHQPRILLVGQITGPFRLRPGPTVDVIGFRFHAGGLHALLGVAMDDLTDRDVAVEDVSPRLGRRLASLLGITDPHRRMAAAARVLVASLDRADIGPITRAAQAIARSHGRVRVDTLARNLGMSPRHVARRFAHEVGVGPKLLARIHRFQWFLREAGRRPDSALGRLAHDAGYYDQSHLIRDFREFAAGSPSTYFGEVHPLGRAMAGLE